RIRAGLPPETRYDDELPRDYWDAAARAERLAAMGVDETVVFPNFGLLWERTLDADLGALTANMTAWNRWCASVAVDGRGKVHPVAHVTLRDERWILDELARLERDGVRLAMVAPALVDGRPLAPMPMRPSDYCRRQVRVSSFSYEMPARLIRQTGDLYMCCSDYPHSEGTATPLADYADAAVPVGPEDAPGLFRDNVSMLLE